MRTYFVSSGLQGCYIVRCLLPLQANGWDGDQTSIFPQEKSPESKKTAAINSDVIVFHRPENHEKLKLARHLKSLGKKIVYDNDDTYLEDNSVKANSFMTEERIKRGLTAINNLATEFIKEADLVTCSTEFLAEEYRKINPNVVVMPNCVDPFLFDEPLKNDGNKVRIGITGSVGLTTDLDELAPIFRHYENDPRVELVFFSLNEPTELIRQIYDGEFRILESFKNVEWHPLVPAFQYFEKLNSLKLDIQIIPRADNYFNRCKSNLKFLESSMLEIPVIAQSFSDKKSPYETSKNDKDYMLLAKNTAEFIEHIETLINDKEKRKEMGRKAREYVEREYNIEDNAHLWEEAYDKII